MKNGFTISVVLLIIAFIPALILGEHGHVQVFDNLDSEFIYLHVLKQQGLLFSHADNLLVDQIFNGLSTRYYHSEFSFIRVIFYLLPSFWAYVLNSFLVRFIGLIGIHLLLRDYIQLKGWPTYLIVALYVSFALLPVYSLYGLSVMGQPLLLWCFLNLHNRSRLLWSSIFIVAFPFYSHFAMVAPFVMTALACLMIWIHFAKGGVGRFFAFGFLLLGVSFLAANRITIGNFLWSNVASHRSEWLIEFAGFYSVLKSLLLTLLFGQMHSAKLFALPLYLGFGVLLFCGLARKRLTIILLSSVFFIALFYACYPFMASTLKPWLQLLTTFQFSRFTFLLPFLLYLLAFSALSDFTKLKSPIHRKLFTSLMLLFAMGNIAGNKEILFNWSTAPASAASCSADRTFHSFFAPDFFADVKNCIPAEASDYRVVCLGFHPSIAQFSGFSTLDSYQNNYPLAYKHQFRKIIEPELLKSESLRAYFDNWGNRCYMFSSEMNMNFDVRSNDNLVLKDFDFDHAALKSMGCAYIISVVEILGFESKGLHLHKELVHSNYPYRILVYSL
jgi:hypothetical protein